MNNEYTIIDYEDWIEKYKPKQNDRGGMIDVNPRYNNMTTEDFNQATKDCKIWSLTYSSDVSIWTIVNGYHFLKVLEYFYCEVPFGENELIKID